MGVGRGVALWLLCGLSASSCQCGSKDNGAPPPPPPAGDPTLIPVGIGCSLAESTIPLPGPVAYPAAVISNGFVYVVGGSTNPTLTAGANTVYFAQLDGNGLVSKWSSTTSTPGNLYQSGLLAKDGFLYLIGGANPPMSPVAQVSIARQNPDGTLGAWSLGPALPDERMGAGTVLLDDFIYSIGGFSTADLAPGSSGVNCEGSAPVYYSRINPDGTLNPWETNGASMNLTGRALLGAAAYGGRIYIVGGMYILSHGMAQLDKVLIGGPDKSGAISEWDRGRVWGTPLESPGVQIVGDTLVVLDGLFMGMATSTIIGAPINSDGSLGVWALLGNDAKVLNATISGRATAATATAIYAFGGWVSNDKGGQVLSSWTMSPLQAGALTCPMVP